MIKINPDKIRDVIGPGGKLINKIIEETDVKIDTEQDGTIYIASPDEEMNAKAKEIIENIVREAKVGEYYLGKLNELKNSVLSLKSSKEKTVFFIFPKFKKNVRKK